jgi:hypothetical protein
LILFRKDLSGVDPLHSTMSAEETECVNKLGKRFSGSKIGHMIFFCNNESFLIFISQAIPSIEHGRIRKKKTFC